MRGSRVRVVLPQLWVFLLLLNAVPVKTEEIVDWALYYDRPNYGGWGSRINLPDLLVSATGRYEFLDQTSRLGECQYAPRRLDEITQATLEQKLFPVASRYEMDSKLETSCHVTDAGDGVRIQMKFQLDSGRSGYLYLSLQPGWCDFGAHHSDVRNLQQYLQHLVDSLPATCVD